MKYNIAWFKLAEFVMRKEKERALAIYRLLAHSLPDQALASQLEGDIFMSFADDKAINSYLKAAILYEKNKQYVQAAAVYEHLLCMFPGNVDHAHKLVMLYHIVNNEIKLPVSVSVYAKMLVHSNRVNEINETLNGLNEKFKIAGYEALIYALIDAKYEESLINYYLTLIVKSMNSYDVSLITKFVSNIRALDDHYYQYTKSLIKLDSNRTDCMKVHA